MCMTVNREQTDQLRYNGPRFVRRYKVLYKADRYRSILYPEFVWVQGENWPVILRGLDGPSEYIVGHGALHVYKNLADAELTAKEKPSRIIIAVRCEIKDLVAVGTCQMHWERLFETEAYTAVYVDSFDEVKGSLGII